MDQREQIEGLLDVGNLSKWEYSFLIDIGSRLDRGETLTDDQQKKLDEILEEKGR